MKYLFFFLIYMLIIDCYSQDTDGDGISDQNEIEASKQFSGQIPFATYYNRLIADFPEIAIRFSDVKMGIRFKLTNKTTTTTTIKNLQQTDNSSLVTKKTFNSESVSNQLTATVKAGYGVTGWSGSLSIEDQFKVSSENGFSYSKSDIEQYKKEITQIKTEENSDILLIDSDAGYVTCTVYFFNPDPVRTVTISNVRIHIVKFDQNGTRLDQNVMSDYFVSLAAPIVGQQSIITQTNNRLILPPRQSIPVNFIIEKLNSSEIDNLIRNNITFGFELIPPYELEFTDPKTSSSSYKLSAHTDDINNKCFTLRITGKNEDKRYLIAKTDGVNNITIKKALETVFPDSDYLKFEKLNIGGKSVFYVKKLGDLISNLDLTIKPEDYTLENKNQGFWFVLSSYSKELYSDLDLPVIDKLNAHPYVSLIYVKGMDLLNQSFIRSDPAIIEANMDSENTNTNLSINSENLIELKIKVFNTTYSTNKTKSIVNMPAFVNGQADAITKYNNIEKWEPCEDIYDLSKLHFSIYIDQLNQEFNLSDCKIIEKYYDNDFNLILRIKLNTDKSFSNATISIRSYYNKFSYGQIQLKDGYEEWEIYYSLSKWIDQQSFFNSNSISSANKLTVPYLFTYDQRPFGIDGKNITEIIKDNNTTTIYNIKKKAIITLNVLSKN